MLPQVFHINEGHAGVPRPRAHPPADRSTRASSFSEAKTAIRPGGVFTTHTPVPAGIDRFPRELDGALLHQLVPRGRRGIDELMELGHEPGTPDGEVFNMAVMSAAAGRPRQRRGSKLHGGSSREMFADVWPERPDDEVPIGSVTNGVHGRTWVSRRDGRPARTLRRPRLAARPTERAVGGDHDVPDAELWTVRRAQPRAPGARSPADGCAPAAWPRASRESQVAWTDEALDPSALTIGFARRFATYKRADLLLRDLDRLSALLLDAEPAGAAHLRRQGAPGRRRRARS